MSHPHDPAVFCLVCEADRQAIRLATPPSPTAEGNALLHQLLMPPHPGDVYQSSALCSCGGWQSDADNQRDLFDDYRTLLLEHTEHVVAALRKPEGS